ncbi:hypothetical protein Slin15195_G092970 [Septoria linicola]|uniref:Uncharacterized protein n=1 Tax=Septoria linicola TaxID=215465 RepID=A0A9Q9B1R1_9PEZI|nr:hypothetical protein Slin15195_G092970 [Septoria linicola]
MAHDTNSHFIEHDLDRGARQAFDMSPTSTTWASSPRTNALYNAL